MMKPTPDQRRILRLFVVDRVLARGFTGLHWLDPDAERPTETVNALTCAFFKVEGGQLILTERGQWTARDMATGLFWKADARHRRALASWQAALEAAAHPYRAPVIEFMEHARIIMRRAELLKVAVENLARARARMRAWEEMVPRPRSEARMAKLAPGYVPKAQLMVCEKHRKAAEL